MKLLVPSLLALFLIACGSDSSMSSNDSDDDVSSKSSSSSRHSGLDPESSSSSVVGCKTVEEDNCEYGELVDDRDGQTYKTVTIGSQIWMAENLNFKTDSSFCYNNEETNCTKYGRLYTWAAAVGRSESDCGYGNTCSLPSGNIQGVCPSGWHLPSKAEWETLFNAVDGQSTAGKVLKSTSGWNSSGNGSDAFGFSALPAGLRDDYGDFYGEGNYVYFWSSTENFSLNAYIMHLLYNVVNARLIYSDKLYGFSVRCVKD